MKLEKFKALKNLKINTGIFFFVALCYMEFITRAFTYDSFFGIGLLFIPLFSVLPTAVLYAVCSAINEKWGKIVTAVTLAIYFLIYVSQTIYFSVFGSYFIMYSLKAGGVSQILGSGMIDITAKAILRGIPAILLLAAPLVLYIIFGNKNITYRRFKWYFSLTTGLSGICVHILLAIIISLVPVISEIQSGNFDINNSVKTFGLIRSEVLDFKYNIIGVEQETKIDLDVSDDVLNIGVNKPSKPTSTPIDTSPNVMDIDFEALNENESNSTYKQLNSYFASKTPTNKNEYTGMYEGYNLIYITAEAFSPYCIDEELTPTLYKMTNEGFKFTNFYTPSLGVSTTSGEFTYCTGLLPDSNIWSFKESSDNNMYFCLGNMFNRLGIDRTYAYHNHTYSYYDRHITHPNMGYTYKGYGNGLEKYVKKVWPESDLEMIAGSADEYISSDEPFHAYYMTVSGHFQYSFSGNSMCSRNKDKVKHLDCSEKLKAYYACNIELDKAMEKLLEKLNDAGVADRTVIVISADHYPYGLENETDKYSVWREVLGHDVDTTFELYESNLILYCQGTKNAPTIDKYCSSVDVLPTILNLFGLEYDSRLLIGNDILSDSGALVQLRGNSFITDMGKYNATTGEFTLFEGKSFASNDEKKTYIDAVKKIVANNFKISRLIIQKDYYGYLFD